MNIIKNILKHFLVGNTAALFIVGIIHLYSLVYEPYFCYAEWDTIFQTVLISGIPFGLAMWSFATLRN